MFDGFQVTFDAEHAPTLAAFWALALDSYELQPPPPGFGTWNAFADSIDMPKEERDDLAAIIDPTGAGPRILFLKVPESKTSKNRVHLDVVANEPDDPEHQNHINAKVAQLVEAGATETARHSKWGSEWVVMHDPEGNEFCVV